MALDNSITSCSSVNRAFGKRHTRLLPQGHLLELPGTSAKSEEVEEKQWAEMAVAVVPVDRRPPWRDLGLAFSARHGGSRRLEAERPSDASIDDGRQQKTRLRCPWLSHSRTPRQPGATLRLGIGGMSTSFSCFLTAYVCDMFARRENALR